MSTVSTNICTWGNSRGIRLPKTVLDLVGLSDNDEVTLTIDDDAIIIRKAVHERKRRSYPSLAERFAGYSGDYVPEEWDVGKSVGREV